MRKTPFSRGQKNRSCCPLIFFVLPGLIPEPLPAHEVSDDNAHGQDPTEGTGHQWDGGPKEGKEGGQPGQEKHPAPHTLGLVPNVGVAEGPGGAEAHKPVGFDLAHKVAHKDEDDRDHPHDKPAHVEDAGVYGFRYGDAHDQKCDAGKEDPRQVIFALEFFVILLFGVGLGEKLEKQGQYGGDDTEQPEKTLGGV